MNKISVYRNKAGLSQGQLAAKIGWSQSRIGNYEAANRTPSLADSRKIVAALNQLGITCSLDDVFPDEIDGVIKDKTKDWGAK